MILDKSLIGLVFAFHLQGEPVASRHPPQPRQIASGSLIGLIPRKSAPNDLERAERALEGIKGKRLTYRA